MQTWTMSSLSVNDAVTTSRDLVGYHGIFVAKSRIWPWLVSSNPVDFGEKKNKTSRWDCPLPPLNILWFGAGASELVFILWSSLHEELVGVSPHDLSGYYPIISVWSMQNPYKTILNHVKPFYSHIFLLKFRDWPTPIPPTPSLKRPVTVWISTLLPNSVAIVEAASAVWWSPKNHTLCMVI